jgi:16S rRNA (cytosine1402-N4)-methyltransferase
VNEHHHVPVLLEEALQALQVKEDGVYVDATYGRGGHAQQILTTGDARTAAGVRPRSAGLRGCAPSSEPTRMKITQGLSRWNARSKTRAAGKINGILSTSASSPHLDDAHRGSAAPTDRSIRAWTCAGESATEWIRRAEENEIARVIREYGEERFAKRIARAIVREREIEPITTTRRLAVLRAPYHRVKKQGLGRAFQAIRIHINRELDELRARQTIRLLAIGDGWSRSAPFA